jgi:hypothetical protein
MKIARFMSVKELGKFLNGQKIVARTDYKAAGKLSGAEGKKIHFLPFRARFYSGVLGNYNVLQGEECLEFIGGIVCSEVLVTFKVKQWSAVSQGYGTYADPYGSGMFCPDRISVKEFYMDFYDQSLLEIVNIQHLNRGR